jgi:septum formation protein
MLPPLVLASSSPRRRELLRELEVGFEIVAPEVDETPLPGEPPWALVTRLARAKARSVSKQFSGRLVLGADTVVALDGELLNKPAHREEARRMLERLSGRVHEVWTGVCLARDARVLEIFATVSHVRFRVLSPAEIEAYLDTGEGYDKAGGYAAQGSGRQLIEVIEGSLNNVIGLPTEELRPRLSRHLWTAAPREAEGR